ncbi:Ras GTPase activating domain protein [Fadolivirus algeromassiliense]|jgi:hypothetical protein|uniref:Ras GTPase activating domain protein n=1 Tax=Fadolivirus FV1/VV64 TaxID=3070911 RepID=A0A7D3URD6_9VIRU|nr:Ras GTPase activating domain protein [Fadolivirus algeromassiliense]QKF94553.1 Ras GTPase activating domain protein [Fadolivirus FV1/VV64]
MEKNEYNIEEEFIDTIVSKHSDIFLNINDSFFGIKLLELLVHYGQHNTLCRYLEKCVNLIISESDLILRSDCIATNILSRFVEICLTEPFNKFCNQKDILSECFILCSNAPDILRYVCYLLFNACSKINPSDPINMLGYRAVSILVIFRFYNGTIANKHLHNKEIINECKKLQSIARFDDVPNTMIMSLIKMIIAYDIGNSLTYKFNEETINNNLQHIIIFSRKNIDESNNIHNLCDTIEKKMSRSSRILKRIPSLRSLGKQKVKELPRKSKSFNDTIYGDDDTVELTKKIFQDAGLTMYNELIDENCITLLDLLSLDKESVEKLGIKNKEHINKILKIVQKYNQIDKGKLTIDLRLTQSQASL